MRLETQKTHSIKQRLTFLVNTQAAHIVAILTALMGIFNVLSASLPGLSDRLKILEQFSPLEVTHGSRIATTLAGFALLLLSANLWRRKQVAWLLTLAVLIISIFSHLLKGLDYEEASIAALLGIGLFTLRFHFHARSDRPSIKQGISVLIAAIVFTLVYGVAGFYLLDKHFSVNFNFLPAIEQTILMFTQITDPGLEPITGFGRYFADSIYMIATGTIGYSLIMLVRPVLLRQPATQAERRQAQAIVEKYGRSSLARFTLLEDKSYFFSPNGSMIAFVIKGRIALALGDPIGSDGDIETSILAFKEFCAVNDWQACFYQVLPDYLNVYKSNGYHAVSIGQEGIVDLNTFSLEGKAGKDFRTATNRLNRLGYRIEVYEPPLSDAALAELRIVSDEWLQMMHGNELGFSLGRFEDNYIRHSTVVAARTPEGHISAFTNIISEYQHNEVALDLMRRRHEIENGTIDFLFISMFDWAKKKGYATFSLGLSALSGVGEKSKDPTIERTLGYIYENADRIYNFKGLHSFKDKFRPQWEPRYLIYPELSDLPALATGLARAHSGDDFIWAYFKK
jgi:phosphatidylglycerol lysyltransferase